MLTASLIVDCKLRVKTHLDKLEQQGFSEKELDMLVILIGKVQEGKIKSQVYSAKSKELPDSCSNL